MTKFKKEEEKDTEGEIVLTVDTWNVKTLVESTEDEQVCRRRLAETSNNLGS